jgi:hypothetical protein
MGELIKAGAPVKPNPVEEMQDKLREEAIEIAQKTLATLVALLDPKSRTAPQVFRLIKRTAGIHADLLTVFGGDVLLKQDTHPRDRDDPDEPGIIQYPTLTSQIGGMDSETFGAQAIGQMMGLARSLLMGNNQPSKEIRDLSEALGIATEANLPSNVRSGIEKKLMQALGGEDPPDSLPTANDLMEVTK